MFDPLIWPTSLDSRQRSCGHVPLILGIFNYRVRLMLGDCAMSFSRASVCWLRWRVPALRTSGMYTAMRSSPCLAAQEMGSGCTHCIRLGFIEPTVERYTQYGERLVFSCRKADNKC